MSTSATGAPARASPSTGGAWTLLRPTWAHSPSTRPRSRSCVACSATSSTTKSPRTWTLATTSPARRRSTGSGTGASSRRTARRRSLCPWLLRQTDGQRLELVDERRLDVLAVADDLHLRIALEDLLEHDLQLEAGQRSAEAEVAAARAERLMVRVALDVEALRVVDLGLVPVRRDVPHDDLLALLDVGVVQLHVLRGR